MSLTLQLVFPGLYHLARPEEINVPIATADIMVSHPVPKQKQNKKHSHGIAANKDPWIKFLS
jgi:hypothetical protein